MYVHFAACIVRTKGSKGLVAQPNVWQHKFIVTSPSYEKASKALMVGRPALIITPEERKRRRNEQIARCKAVRRQKDLYMVQQKSNLQRWDYRRRHPESVQKEKERIAAKKAALFAAELKERRKLERIAAGKFIKTKLFRD